MTAVGIYNGLNRLHYLILKNFVYLRIFRSGHGRSMTSLHRLCQPSHLSSNASSVTSCRGFGTQRRLMAAHHRHLAESTLKLWQQKPQNFVFIGGAKGRRKSLSVTSLRCSKADFVWRWKQKCFESVTFQFSFVFFRIPFAFRYRWENSYSFSQKFVLEMCIEFQLFFGRKWKQSVQLTLICM